MELDKETEKFYRESLGNAAKRISKYLKKNGDLRRFKPFTVFTNIYSSLPVEPSDIVGHLFVEAFEDVNVALYAYVEIEKHMVLGKLPQSILDDLSGLNDAKFVKNRRRSYIKLLREFSDWALEEGQFDPKHYVEE